MSIFSYWRLCSCGSIIQRIAVYPPPVWERLWNNHLWRCLKQQQVSQDALQDDTNMFTVYVAIHDHACSSTCISSFIIRSVHHVRCWSRSLWSFVCICSSIVGVCCWCNMHCKVSNSCDVMFCVNWVLIWTFPLCLPIARCYTTKCTLFGVQRVSNNQDSK